MYPRFLRFWNAKLGIFSETDKPDKNARQRSLFSSSLDFRILSAKLLKHQRHDLIAVYMTKNQSLALC